MVIKEIYKLNRQEHDMIKNSGINPQFLSSVKNGELFWVRLDSLASQENSFRFNGLISFCSLITLGNYDSYVGGCRTYKIPDEIAPVLEQELRKSGLPRKAWVDISFLAGRLLTTPIKIKSISDDGETTRCRYTEFLEYQIPDIKRGRLFCYFK